MATSLDGITKILPEDSFFQVSQPDAPIVQIQIRVGGASGLNKTSVIDDVWEEIHLKNGVTNYFNSMIVEDSGGMQRVSMSFFDKNFVNLESAIIKSIVSTKIANSLSAADATKETTVEAISMKIDNTSMINMRVRFGYTDYGDDFIDDGDFNGTYEGRVDSEQTVIRSPWIYLQTIGIKFNLKAEGMYADITAISVVDSVLSKAKILKKYAVLRGTPETIIKDIFDMLEEKSDSTIIMETIDDPISIVAEDGTTDAMIEINLGTEANETSQSWRSVRSLLAEVMQKIPTKKYGAGQDPSGTTGDADSTEVTKEVAYQYTVTQEKEESGKIISKFTFGYPKPGANQGFMRSYFWKQNAMSIVKNLNISSAVDFASLNTQIVTVDKSGSVSLNVARESNVTSGSTKDEESSTNLTGIQDATKGLIDYRFGLVSDVHFTDGNGSMNAGDRIANAVIHNLNQGVFKGTIEIPGDPFYLFDKTLQPYGYVIYIAVQRPSGMINEIYTGNEKSYLTGFYYVKKITHNINASGFSTTLEIIRWPVE